MIKIFETLEKYNTYTNNGQNLESGDLYYVKEDNSTHYLTNNIDGVTTIYDTVETPSGNIEITENGEDIDIAQYATATVDVPIPEGYIIPTGNKSITANGENIDVNDYATASVNVPVPPEYIIPTGNVSLTENGENINIAQYATATVNVAAQAKNYIVEGTEYDPTATYTGAFFLDKPRAIKKVNIPNGYTSLSNNALMQCYDMTDVVIPNSVTTIGNSAFANCNNIDTLTIPNSVTSIGYGLLENGDTSPQGGVKHIVIGSGLATIGTNSSSYGLLGTAATRRCESITVDSNNQTYDSRNNCNAIIETATNTLLLGCNNTVIPNTVTTIGEYVFRNCSGLKSITIPDSVTSIGNNAFYGCRGLTSLTIPDSVTTIGEGAFSYCSGLTSVTIPDSVTSIGNYVFSSCTNLTTITIHATTPPTLGSDAFYMSNKINKIYVPAESVEAYKAANRWSTKASIIQAIPTT